jgi:hypothetical protein
MGFGLWQKIKHGLAKVVGGIGKGLGFVKDKVLKPALEYAKPIIGAVAPMIGGKAGMLLKGVDIASNLISKGDALEPKLKTMQQKLDPRLS